MPSSVAFPTGFPNQGGGPVATGLFGNGTPVFGLPSSVAANMDAYYSNAVGAYSVRKLFSGYNGPCMTVQRSSDNATQAIGFVNGWLDTASLLTFCAGSNGSVTTWYDQSTNANNMTVAAVGSGGNLPTIVSAGSLLTANSKPAIRMSPVAGSTNGSRLVATGLGYMPQGASPRTLSAVYQPLDATNTYTITSFGGSGTNGWWGITRTATADPDGGAMQFDESNATAAPADTKLKASSWYSDGVTCWLDKNGNNISSAAHVPATAPGNFFAIGYTVYTPSNDILYGNVSEVVVLNSSIGLSGNQAAAFNAS